MHNGIKKYIAMGIFAISCGLFNYSYGINFTGSTIYGNVDEAYSNATNNAYIEVTNNINFITDEEYNYLYVGQTNGRQQNWWGRNTGGTDIITINGRRIITTSGRCILEGEYRTSQITPSSCTETTETAIQQIKQDTITWRAIGDALNIYNWTQPSLCLYSNTKTYCRLGHTRDLYTDDSDISSWCSNSQGCNEPEKMVNYFGESPINGGGGQNGYTQLPMCYTIQQKIDSFPNNYNIEMCYSSNKIWSGNQFVTVTPKSMLELRPTYDEYIEDVNLYQNYCGNNIANTQACGEAFSGKNEERSIINKLYNQGTTTILRSYDYCYLQLNFTEEQKRTRTNCTMGTGLQHGSGITTDDIIEDMQNHQIVIITPDGNTVYSGFWNNGSGDNEANLSYDGIVNSIQSVRGKLTNIFYYRTGVTGIIPDYITRILLLIVLFAIFKK